MATTDIDRIWVLVTRKLMDEATGSELAELSSLLQKYPEQNEVLQSLTRNWDTGPEKDAEFLEATYLVHLSRMQGKGYKVFKPGEIFSLQPAQIKKKKKIFFLIPVVVVVAAIMILKFGFSGKQGEKASFVIEDSKNEISTKNGSRTKVQLPDGSVVWLNAGSQLDYGKDFGTTNREVHLSGEGFFDVVKNPDKPFIIHTRTIDVKVLGTQFNVKSYPADKTTETSLIRGSVEIFVKNRSGKMVLKPNEKLVVYNDVVINNNSNLQKETEKIPLIAIRQLTYQNNDTMAVETSWTQNKLSFKNELFADVARKMERWYDVSFEFDNKSKENLLMYGTFTTETVREALEALVFSFGFKYRIENKKVIIY